MKMAIDAAGQRTADALDVFEIGDAGTAHPLGRSEGAQQGFLAFRPNAGHLVRRVGRHALEAPGAMGADGEAVRLVAQPLDEIEHRLARLEHEGWPARQMKMLPPGITVGSL